MDINADVSSYPKAAALPAQQSVIGQIGQFQQLESNRIGIDQQKLNLMNAHFNVMNKELSNLANMPGITKDVVLQRMHAIGDTFNMPAPVRQQMESEFANANTPQQVQQQLDFVIRRGMDTQQRINSLYGAPGSVDNGQTVTPTRQGLRGGPVPVAPPIQTQLPPSTQVPTPGGVQTLGSQQPQVPAGAAPIPGGLPGQYQPSQPTTNLPVTPPAGSGAAIKPAGPMASYPPTFDAGVKQYSMDQDNAVQRSTALKPILQALPLIEGLRTGPGTDTWNKGIAFLKANGIVNIDPQSDPTAVYQEVNKKLSQYVQNSGSRSDAQQALNEESSPNAKTQIQPALIKLVKDQIALDRVQIARPTAFNSQDFSKYGQHRSTFPQHMDERAFGLDLMKPDERQKLVTAMSKNLQSKNPAEVANAKRFFDSLRIAKTQNFYSGE